MEINLEGDPARSLLTEGESSKETVQQHLHFQIQGIIGSHLILLLSLVQIVSNWKDTVAAAIGRIRDQ